MITKWKMKNSAEKYILKAKQWVKAISEKTTDTLMLNEDEAKIFFRLQDGSYENWRNEHGQKFDEDAVWKTIEEQITTRKKSKVVHLLRYWPSVAAILILGLLSYQAYFIYSDFRRKQKEALIIPGKSQAYLEIDNTERIALGKLDTLLLFKKAEAKVNADQLVYAASDLNVDKNEYHKINVPRNGEFHVELSDGTKVWVNSESTLGFHSRFDGKQRVVELTGEAYFEVAKNPNQPFIVRTANADVRVLGTHFNVRAYEDEAYTYATLNEGKVRVSNEKNEQDILPDEQIVINNSTGDCIKKQVDADIYSAWVKGKFVFKDERLEDILHSISRWYDIQVFYENQELQNERFSISLDRYENISSLLEHIEMTESVEFEVKDKVLIVK